jgi:redox-sensitive bicupin YhaK (pirin superfamily)
MSVLPAEDPQPGDRAACDLIQTVIVPRVSDLGDGFHVRRALPSTRRRMVGPFIFWDEMGPAEFLIGNGLDVRPHPHIGLATVTYLFEGEIVHRDSLGTVETIAPGAVNLMSAGRGIVHSERSGLDVRTKGGKLAGIQSWVALPQDREEDKPAFRHHASDDLPLVHGEGKSVKLIAGSMLGATSPVETAWDTIYADATLEAGATLPFDANWEERAIYTLDGEIDIAGDTFGPHQLLVFKPGDRISVKALTAARFMLLGGATMDGPRYIWWNFVSSRKERIEQAKADWAQARFDTVPGENEFIPLPQG